jgi:hypothetical protein
MELRAVAFLVAGFLFLTGCSAYHDVDNATSIYQSAHSALGSFAELNFEPIRIGASESFGLDASSPTFEFPRSGKSYFKAFELPIIDGPSTLTVRSSSFQNGYPSKGFAVFYPAITFLNKQKQPVAELDWADAQKEFLQPQGMGTAYVELVSDMAIHPSARYAIVHTHAACIGVNQRLHYLVPVPSPAVGALVDLTGGRDAAFDVMGAPDSPSGNVEIEFDRKH